MAKPITEAEIEARYQNSYGRAAGYLPPSRKAVNAWQTELLRRARARTAGHVEPVQELADLLTADKALQDLVNETVQEALALNPTGPASIEDVLNSLDEIVTHAPGFSADPNSHVAFPMSALFVYMMATESGWELFREAKFNDALRVVLTAWCTFLDSPESRDVLYRTPGGWLCPAAYDRNRLYEFQVDLGRPYGGFDSFNSFFHRPVKPECRPNAARYEPRAVVSANDGQVVRVYPDVR
ncbi:phophatidylserine decarboxylase associated domain-containing protein [Streptomyces caatingaensis]|uniref:phophatidylserine decarboxylase associated domain-containing protein n=1 Tax=Streptomyces caatingaensis TaxID=1678637 RepID=UPI00067286D6|nr:phophatidylserine decarboxylase associated domain-containing protein [Streptomyces caatingaensis]